MSAHPWWARWRGVRTRSLRLRLVALFLLLALGLAITFVLGMQHALGIGWREAARPLVADYLDRLVLELGSPPQIARAQALSERLPLSVHISGPQVQWSSEGAREEHFDGAGKHWRRDDDAPRFFERRSADGHRVRFGLRLADWHERPLGLGWLALAALLGLTALAYARVRALLRPLDDIRCGALRFGRGDFTAPIAVRDARHPDELGELAATINTMGADIAHMLDAKRALLLAISHELRSPLTRARLNTELLPESGDLAPHRQALLRDLAQMRDLVTDLLESERLSSRHAALHCEAVDLGALVAAVLEERGADAKGVRCRVQDGLPCLQADAARLRLLVRNLLDNALRHSPQQAPEFDVRRDQDCLVLAVRDYGPGVDPEHLAQLGQAFFRPDRARSRSHGGVGLGLYLCRLVVQAHGGALSLHNAEPGLCVQVKLPLVRATNAP